MMDVYLLLIFLSYWARVDAVFIDAGCGGYMTPSKDDTGRIRSPNYPSNYSNLDRCIWTIEAPENYRINLTIHSVNLESENSTCIDYLDVRDGNSSAFQRYYGCDLSSNVTVQSDSRWLWIKFYTNYLNTDVGFQATWFIHYKGYDRTPSAIVACKGYHFTCPNAECISSSYLCDKQNDCGYVGPDSDESSCGSFSLPLDYRMGVGVGGGCATFILVILITVAVEGYCKCCCKKAGCPVVAHNSTCLPCCPQKSKSRRHSKVKRVKTNPAILILTGEGSKLEKMEKEGKLQHDPLMKALGLDSHASVNDTDDETVSAVIMVSTPTDDNDRLPPTTKDTKV